MSKGTEITVTDQPAEVAEYTPELSVERVIEQTRKVHELVAKVMKQDEHYGPAFKDGDKNVLYKQGAEKFNLLFQVRAEYDIDEKLLPTGHREYKTVCTLMSRGNDAIVATGVGLCTTMEKKYRWRNASLTCPECNKETVFKSKKPGEGWYCWAKKGGCGMQFAADDTRLSSQDVGKKENEDIADVYNTVLKISKKRAYVDATITLGALSDLFTQDIEDFRDESTAASTQTALELSSADRDKINISVRGLLLLADNPEVDQKMREYLATIPALTIDTYANGQNPAPFLEKVTRRAEKALSPKPAKEKDIAPPAEIDAKIAEEVKKVHKNTLAGVRLCVESGYIQKEPSEDMIMRADSLLEAGNEAGLNKLYEEVRKIFDDGAEHPPAKAEEPKQAEIF